MFMLHIWLAPFWPTRFCFRSAPVTFPSSRLPDIIRGCLMWPKAITVQCDERLEEPGFQFLAHWPLARTSFNSKPSFSNSLRLGVVRPCLMLNSVMRVVPSSLASTSQLRLPFLLFRISATPMLAFNHYPLRLSSPVLPFSTSHLK